MQFCCNISPLPVADTILMTTVIFLLWLRWSMVVSSELKDPHTHPENLSRVSHPVSCDHKQTCTEIKAVRIKTGYFCSSSQRHFLIKVSKINRYSSSVALHNVFPNKIIGWKSLSLDKKVWKTHMVFREASPEASPLLSTGMNSGGCMQKMGGPTKCEGAQKEAADSAAVQVSSIATTKILIPGGWHVLLEQYLSENPITPSSLIHIRYASVMDKLGNNGICKNSHQKSEPPAAKIIKKQAEARLIHLSETKPAFIINNNKK